MYKWVAVSVVGAVIGAVFVVRGVDRRRRFVAECQTKALEIAAAYAVMKSRRSSETDLERTQPPATTERWAEEHLKLAEKALRATGAYDEAITVHDARLAAEHPAVFARSPTLASPPLVDRGLGAQVTTDQVAWVRDKSPNRAPVIEEERTRRDIWPDGLRSFLAPTVFVALLGVLATLIGAGGSWATVVAHPPPSPAPVVKNNVSPVIKPAPVHVTAGADCVAYLADLAELVDSEPHVASRLPGGSFALDQDARSCGLKRKSDVNALAAFLAQR